MGLIPGRSKEDPRKIERGKHSILFIHQDYLLLYRYLTNTNHSILRPLCLGDAKIEDEMAKTEKPDLISMNMARVIT